MKVLVTGAAGHLGEALAITLKARGDEVIGLDRLPSAHTDHVGSITDVNIAQTQLLQARNASTDAYSTALSAAATLALATGALGTAPR